MGDLYAAQTVGVGFYSSPGEGAESHALFPGILLSKNYFLPDGINSIKVEKCQYNFISSQLASFTND
jgi:hypothetical protein